MTNDFNPQTFRIQILYTAIYLSRGGCVTRVPMTSIHNDAKLLGYRYYILLYTSQEVAALQEEYQYVCIGKH